MFHDIINIWCWYFNADIYVYGFDGLNIIDDYLF